MRPTSSFRESAESWQPLYSSYVIAGSRRRALIAALPRNDVDLVVLNDAPPQFARHVLTGGRRVFCRDAEIDTRS
jgi:hypothetical protein